MTPPDLFLFEEESCVDCNGDGIDWRDMEECQTCAGTGLLYTERAIEGQQSLLATAEGAA